MNFKIGNRGVGPGEPVYFIAEIGSNHDGSLAQAKKLIAAAIKAGADAVKFQSFTADGLYVSRVRENGKWKENPTWKAFKQWELPEKWLAPLTGYCRKLKVPFLSTPFESSAIRALDEAGMPAFKIASGDMTHLTLIREAAKTGKPVLIATGMANLDEVRRAVEAVRAAAPVALFHCVSLYPPKFEEMNLRAVATLIREFGCPVGLSDHTPGWEAVLGAVALGATLVEKHVTLDRKLKGPDHPYALEMDEFAEMVRAVRNLEKALGNGAKQPAAGESAERKFARRGIYAACDIQKGSVLKGEMIQCLRPALGLGADQIDRVIGAIASRDLQREEPLTLDNISPIGRMGPAERTGRLATSGRPLSIAVIGCGSIGRRHALNLKSLGFSPAALCDPDGKRLESVSKELGGVDKARWPKVYSSVQAMTENGFKPDAAIVCTPSSDHVQTGIILARAGVSILMEKPLGISEDRLEELERAVKASPGVFMMAMCYRYHPGLRLLRDTIQSGVNGKVLSALQWGGSYLPDWRLNADYRAGYSAKKSLGGGVLLDSIHGLDIARWIFGEVREVSCELARVGDLEIETEDLASMIFKHETGAVTETHMDYLQRSRRQFIEVICENGNMIWDFDRPVVRRYDADEKKWFEESYRFEINDMYLAEMKDFLAAVQNRTPSPIDLTEGICTLQLALAARRSAATRRFMAPAMTSIGDVVKSREIPAIK